jgi:dGTPase
MSWDQLLDDTRIRKAIAGEDSVKAADEARSEFERDRDRMVYSNPVRRLIGKTQVFPMDPNDHVRTRLVHSLDVSTVAEGLASQVVREVIKNRETLDVEQLRAISKIAETCELLHDLGNPPFGHAGELAIGTWFEGKRNRDEQLLNKTEHFFFPCCGARWRYRHHRGFERRRLHPPHLGHHRDR